MSTSTSLTKLAIAAVTASGNETGNVPANTIDGNPATRWANLAKGSWIQYDLGVVQSIAEVDIAWYKGDSGRISNFVISVSSDPRSAPVTVFSGQSSGSTASLEPYGFALPSVSGRYVRITVNGNNQNDWASITEVQIMGTTSMPPVPSTAPVPPAPVPPTGLDENGVKMIYASAAAGGPNYFYKMADNITSSKYVTTDSNYSPNQMTEGGITFKRLTSGDVHYASTGAVGKTCRVNVNGGGFISAQAHTWQSSGVQYIWTPQDSKNSEFTYYFRVVNFKYDHTSCSTKMHGGIHTGSNDPHASCFEMCFFIGGSSPTKMECAYEYNHPNYSFESVTQNSSNNSKANTWIGRKTCVWTGQTDGKVHAEDYIDWAPFDSSGKPVNNWTKLMSKTFPGTSSNGYTRVPTWGGMNTIRIDGYEYIDIAILSIREIAPPS